jgi:hypothetical protein
MCAAHAGSGAPSFNKYAGLQEFSDAALLFVNLFRGPEGELPRNAFLQGGRAITWYGSDAAHEHAPALLRLKHHATGYSLSKDGSCVVLPPPPASSADSSSSSSSKSSPGSPSIGPCPVGLAVRLAPELPYVYLGLLSFAEHSNPGRRPVCYRWSLASYEELAAEAAADAAERAGAAAGSGGGKGGSSSAAQRRSAALAAATALPSQKEAEAEGLASRGAAQLQGRQGRSHFAAVLAAGGLQLKELSELCFPAH